jgi:hypothetical protein
MAKKSTPQPNLISFLLCDSVIQDRHTGKWSAIGIFDKILSKKFPVFHANMAIYVRLTDVEGKYDIRVEFINQNNDKLSIFNGIGFEVLKRQKTLDFGIPLRNLLIPNEGKYNIDLYFNNSFTKSYPLEVIKSK